MGFTAVRDDGDGSAFKVDGVRGTKNVGSAGDFVGSQTVDTSDRDTDVGDGKFRVGKQIEVASNVDIDQKENDEKTVRTALRFFFSPEGQIFREFMLEEIVTVVDASSREAVIELSKSLGLTNLPAPSFARSIFNALSPELSSQDKQMVQQIRVLVQFLLGDFEG